MTSTNQQRCGNCQAPVDPSDVVCPHCGVLLAAYASISGASAPESPLPDPPAISPTEAPPPPAETGPPPPVPDVSPAMAPAQHRPSSQSPIGDALTRSRQQSRRDLGQLDDEPDALTRIAQDTAALTEMATGHDELADMADGDDELSRMAAGPSGTTFAEEVEAELRETYIDTEQGVPIIEEPAVGAAIPLDATPANVETAAAVLERPVEQPIRAQTTTSEPISRQPSPLNASTARRGVASQPRTTTPQSPPTSPPTTPVATSLRPRDMMLWIPFGLMICVILGIGGRANGFVGFLLFALVVVVFGFLLKTTRATSRKTTTMPKQKPNNRGR